MFIFAIEFHDFCRFGNRFSEAKSTKNGIPESMPKFNALWTENQAQDTSETLPRRPHDAPRETRTPIRHQDGSRTLPGPHQDASRTAPLINCTWIWGVPGVCLGCAWACLGCALGVPGVCLGVLGVCLGCAWRVPGVCLAIRIKHKPSAPRARPGTPNRHTQGTPQARPGTPQAHPSIRYRHVCLACALRVPGVCLACALRVPSVCLACAWRVPGRARGVPWV